MAPPRAAIFVRKRPPTAGVACGTASRACPRVEAIADPVRPSLRHPAIPADCNMASSMVPRAQARRDRLSRAWRPQVSGWLLASRLGRRLAQSATGPCLSRPFWRQVMPAPPQKPSTPSATRQSNAPGAKRITQQILCDPHHGCRGTSSLPGPSTGLATRPSRCAIEITIEARVATAQEEYLMPVLPASSATLRPDRDQVINSAWIGLLQRRLENAAVRG